MKRILFISHDAQRAGAPILLLNLAEALTRSSNNEYSISFLIKSPPYTILERFNNWPTFIAYRPPSLLRRLINKICQLINCEFSLSPYNIYEIQKSIRSIDLIVSNTITNGELLSIVRKYFKGPVFSYIHELEFGVRIYAEAKSVNKIFRDSNYYLAPSQAVVDFLVENFALCESDIEWLPYYIPKSLNLSGPVQSERIFTVGGAGMLGWRKGCEYFVMVCYVFKKRYPEASVRFVWKGAEEGIELDKLSDEVSKCGIDEEITFLPSSIDMSSFYNNIDVFLLVSREDPYPLVVLEAAAAEKPTICFKNSGGAPEFVETSGGGIVVDYLDINAMAESIFQYFSQENVRTQHGRNARKKVSEMHQNPEFIEQKFNSILLKTLKIGN